MSLEVLLIGTDNTSKGGNFDGGGGGCKGGGECGRNGGCGDIEGEME